MREMKLLAILLVALIIGTTPAVAIQFEDQTASPMAVRGRGVAVAAASEVVVSGNNETLNVENTTISDNPMQDATFVTSEPAVSTQNTTMSDDSAQADDQATGADTQYLNDSLDNYTANVTVPQIDTSGIVMQTTDYSCGPAALATVLQNMGFNVTEGDLKVLAGTNNKSGTSMYGLARAAHAKGVSATGMRLSVDDLRTNMIVHVILDGEGHYSVIRKISNESVYLADPSKGNIVLSREEFSAIFTGNVLVISDPNMQVNKTAIQEHVNNTSTVQSENQTLTAGEMQTVRGRVIKTGILAAIAAKKTWAIKTAARIAKRAWNLGQRGRGLARTIRDALSARLPFRNHPRVQRAVGIATGTLVTYAVATIPKNRWCSWEAFVSTKGAFWTAMIWG